MTYTDVFGGANIYPSELSYSSITLTADLQLNWPLEASASGDFATRIMDLSASSAGLSILMPDAREGSHGDTVLFNNVGSNTLTIKSSTGLALITLLPGTVWQLYLTDNSTESGTWKALQYGAATSAANAAALAGTGIVAVGTFLSQSMPVLSFNSDYTAGASDRAKMYVWTGASGTLTLPVPEAVGNNWFIWLRNSGSGALSVDPSGAATIDGVASLSYQLNESSVIACDGSAYYTIGFGQSATFAFDYTSVDVAGTGSYTLTGSELNRIAYNFTGALTGDRTVIVPSTVQQYWITNSTTGAYVLTIKTAAGTGVTLSSGQSAIYYCNGVNVVDADTSTVSLPIGVSQGGTGAVTPSAALINLGGTALGTALFTSADSAAAYAALGTIPLVDGGDF